MTEENLRKHPKFECAALTQGTGGGHDPISCDHPHCGCDPIEIAAGPFNIEAEMTAFEQHFPYCDHTRYDNGRVFAGRYHYADVDVDKMCSAWLAARRHSLPTTESKITGNATLLLGYLAGHLRHADGLLAYRLVSVDAAQATMTVERVGTENTYTIAVRQTAGTEWSMALGDEAPQPR